MQRIYKTIQATNFAGNQRYVRSAEEREELEGRGINPDFDIIDFRNELRKQAKQNNVWQNKSFLDDKELIHDQKARGTSENDVYRNPDGKTLTKLNNLSYVKSAEHGQSI
ncbi:MAG: hypothetical protein LBR17_04570 [Bacteroidales bacterium]|jgi:hypothetical protein|nr:hypothetical protein [Bacteroidales bacterium]